MAGNIATSMISTFVRANSGIQSTPAAEKPDLMLQLYDIENCPYCRLVREALSSAGGTMDGVHVVDAVVEDLFTKLTRGSEQVVEVRP